MIKVLNLSFSGFLVLMMGIILLSSCNATRFLKEDQSLLKRTKIVFKNEKNKQDRLSVENELLTFIDQKPNDKLLFFIPKEYIYLVNSQPANNHWLGKGLKGLGEPPILYSEDASKKIAANMQKHLRFKKGFYEAKVDFLVDDKKEQRGWSTTGRSDVWQSNTCTVTYLVSLGERYKIKSVNYDCQDKDLLAFVESIKDEAYVKKDDYVDFTQFELEKSRVTVQLQNHGYANFSNSFIEISGDSSQLDKNIDIDFQIRTPVPDTTHTRFVTGNIHVYTDYFKDQSADSLTFKELADVHYYKQSSSFLVRPELLSKSIFFKQGMLLSRDERQKTFRKLNSLGTYRFVTINARPDPERDSIMNFDILLTPFPKKWIYDGGLQGYYSTLGSASLVGFSVSSQFLNRNLLGGSEKYTLKAELGTELGYSKETRFVQRTTNLSIQNNLNIPSYQDFVSLGKIANKVGIIKDKFYKNFLEEASTNIGLGFSALNIINYYSLSSFNASFGFDYTSPKSNRYVFRPLGFNLDLYDIKDSSRFEQNPLIFLSFKDNLGTGFIFRDLSYIYNKPKDRKGNSLLAINNFELSGWEVHFANFLYNKLTGNNNTWVLNNERKIAFAKYARYEFDGRFNKEYSKTRSFAARLNFGIIVPFTKDGAAPFIRQFGVGGPNSLRAWNIKEPGPGGYRDPLAKLKEPQSIFVNQGDIKLELNAEYRFKILLLLDGAFFIDAGNVWTLKTDPNRPGANFTSKFYDQMALGIGYGIRFNFDFFIIRLDCGYKVRSPFADDLRKSNWYTFKEVRQQGLGNVQVAVNYPF